jgi:hypothetical protein
LLLVLLLEQAATSNIAGASAARATIRARDRLLI